MMQAKNADFLDPNATILSLKIEIDRLKYMHKKLIEEIYHNTGINFLKYNSPPSYNMIFYNKNHPICKDMPVDLLLGLNPLNGRIPGFNLTGPSLPIRRFLGIISGLSFKNCLSGGGEIKIGRND